MLLTPLIKVKLLSFDELAVIFEKKMSVYFSLQVYHSSAERLGTCSTLSINPQSGEQNALSKQDVGVSNVALW